MTLCTEIQQRHFVCILFIIQFLRVGTARALELVSIESHTEPRGCTTVGEHLLISARLLFVQTKNQMRRSFELGRQIQTFNDFQKLATPRISLFIQTIFSGNDMRLILSHKFAAARPKLVAYFNHGLARSAIAKFRFTQKVTIPLLLASSLPQLLAQASTTCKKLGAFMADLTQPAKKIANQPSEPL